jgi:cytochrome c biogenesis protein CcmG/thiol:disulfide interchange protein DsbE
MQRNFNRVIILGALGLLVFVFIHSSNHPSKEVPIRGGQTPAFTLENASGKEIQVGGEMKKAVFIQFWTSWCPPCNAEAPEIQKLYSTLGDRIDFIAINSTYYDEMTNAKKFIEDYRWTVPVLFDIDGKVTKLYRSTGFPTSFLVDKHGKIKDIQYGMVEESELARKLTKLSTEK